MSRFARQLLAGLIVLAAVRQACALEVGEDLRPLIRAGGWAVSVRAFIPALAVLRGKAKNPEELDRLVGEQMARYREKLLLASAAAAEGLESDPAVAAAVAKQRRDRVVALYAQREVYGPALALAKQAAAADPSAKEKAVYNREKARLMKEVLGKARGAAGVQVDEQAMSSEAAAREDERVVARVGARAVRYADLRPGMAAVSHPGGKTSTGLAVARIVLDNVIDEECLYQAGEAVFSGSPLLKDDVHYRTINVLAQVYPEKRIYPALKVSPEAVAAYYEKNKESFRRGREKTVHEILLRDEAAARKIVERLKAGENFADLVREASIGPTRDKEGLIGRIQEGEIIPELDGAVGKLAPGETSQPVKSPYGWHVLRCTAVEEGRLPPLEEVRKRIDATLAAEQKASALESKIKEVAAITPVTLDEKALEEIRRKP